LISQSQRAVKRKRDFSVVDVVNAAAIEVNVSRVCREGTGRTNGTILPCLDDPRKPGLMLFSRLPRMTDRSTGTTKSVNWTDSLRWVGLAEQTAVDKKRTASA